MWGLGNKPPPSSHPKVMKPLISLFLIFIASNAELSAQLTERYLKTDTFNMSSSCAVIGDNIYLTYGTHPYFNINPYKQQLIRLDDHLNLIDSFSLDGFYKGAAFESIYTSRLKNIDDTLYLLGIRSFADSVNFLRTEFIAIRLTSQLNPLDTLILSESSLNFDLQDVVKSNGHLYFSGERWNQSASSFKSILLKTSLNLELLNYREHQLAVDSSMSAFLGAIHVIDDSILVVSTSTFRGHNKNLTLFDTSLNHLTSTKFNDPAKPNLTFNRTGEFVSDSSGNLHLVSTSSHYRQDLPPPLYVGDHYNIAVLHLNDQLHHTWTDTLSFCGYNYNLGGSISSTNPIFHYDGLSCRIPDSCFIAVSGQNVFTEDFEGQHLNEIYLYNLNLNSGQTNWQKVLTSHTTGHHTSTDILPGNRYVLVLNEYDWTNYSYPSTSVHVMILDGQGSILTEREFSPSPKVKVYPNPASQFFVVEMKNPDDRYRYEILSTSGETLQQGSAFDGIPVNLNPNLARGTYLLSIYTETQKHHTQKLFLKNE